MPLPDRVTWPPTAAPRREEAKMMRAVFGVSLVLQYYRCIWKICFACSGLLGEPPPTPRCEGLLGLQMRVFLACDYDTKLWWFGDETLGCAAGYFCLEHNAGSQVLLLLRHSKLRGSHCAKDPASCTRMGRGTEPGRVYFNATTKELLREPRNPQHHRVGQYPKLRDRRRNQPL